MPCLIWLAGGVLAFAALSLWAALAGLGLAALAILPVLHARPDGDLPRLRPSEQAAPSGAIAAPAGVDS
jgi:hypothetical protein